MGLICWQLWRRVKLTHYSAHMWTHCVKEPSVHLNSSRVVLWWAHFPNERKKDSKKKSRYCTAPEKGSYRRGAYVQQWASFLGSHWVVLVTARPAKSNQIILQLNQFKDSVRFDFNVNEREARKIMRKLSLFSAKAAAAAVNFNQQNLKWILLFLVLHIFYEIE